MAKKNQRSQQAAEAVETDQETIETEEQEQEQEQEQAAAYLTENDVDVLVSKAVAKRASDGFDAAFALIAEPLRAAGHNPAYIARQRGSLVRGNANADTFAGAARGVLSACLAPPVLSQAEKEKLAREAAKADAEAKEAEAEAKEAEAAAKRANAEAKKARARVKGFEVQDAEA